MPSVASLPIVIVPGIQGHWEWMRPALSALRAELGDSGPTGDRHVLTFSLNEEDGARDPFEQWLAAITRLIAASGSDRVVLIGVSFGGLVAARYAACHPERVAALLLVSTPSPRMRLGRRERLLVRWPRATLPLFAVRGFFRLLPEVIAARPTWRSRLGFAASYARQIMAKPVAPRRMARWAATWQTTDLVSDCTKITAPTHVITGDPHLDRVVPVTSSLDFVSLIPGTTAARLRHTGHVGLVSRPRDFARLVGAFLHAVDDSRSRRSA
jgi:pimeloyl-ACP methyl ester carboxylesterase